MKHKKSLTAVILVAVLLTFTVGGTIAYLMDGTEKVVNTFRPAKVDTEIIEEFTDGNKSSIVIKNKSNSSPAFVRVAIVGNWCDSEGKVVAAWKPEIEVNTTDWVEDGDYYYYRRVLGTDKSTENLLKVPITAQAPEEGLHLEITVMQQAIQAEGVDGDGKRPVTQMWHVQVSVDDRIRPNK